MAQLHNYKPRKRIIPPVEYRYSYQLIGASPGTGCSFPCDKDGSIDESTLHPDGLRNLKACRDGAEFTDEGVQTYQGRPFFEPGTGNCVQCGFKVWLTDAFDNGCDNCGQPYDGDGRALAPRDQWERDW